MKPDIVGITSAVTVVANLISDNMTDDELAFYAAAFAQLGDTLATIAVLRTTEKEEQNM